MNITEKILARASGSKEVCPEEIIEAKVDWHEPRRNHTTIIRTSTK
jgi:hypothetical protein